MQRKMNSPRPALLKNGGQPAFTIVELLVVITIIVILIGLLVPAVGSVRRIAKETASRAVLQTLETGLETYKADSKLGGAYPPSFSDATGGAAGTVTTPYLAPGAGQSIPISGAGLLVWALSGADLLGTPGFQRFENTATWAEKTGNNPNCADPTASGAYALYDAACDPSRIGQPMHQRYGPYVEGSKVKIARNDGAVGSPNFVIPEETKACKALNQPLPTRAYPMYLDTFGYPVLYWRADPAGRQMADQLRNELNTPRGIYHWEDNASLVDPNAVNPKVLVLNKAGEQHALGWDAEFRGNSNPSTPLLRASFPRYIWNESVKARYEPARSDSFLLISPGFDGLYGTADDVTNFEHHGK